MNDTAQNASVTKEVLYLPQEMQFHFKTRKFGPEDKDELGNIPPDYKRPTVKIEVPVPTADGLFAAINADNSGKVVGFILALVQNEIYLEARSQVNEKDPFSQADLNADVLTLEALANRPASERRGASISEELWKQFESDYITVMSSITDKNEKQIKTAAEILVKKFSPVREKKSVIATLRGYLQQWFAATTQGEDLQQVYDYLDSRAETLLTAEVTPKTYDI